MPSTTVQPGSVHKPPRSPLRRRSLRGFEGFDVLSPEGRLGTVDRVDVDASGAPSDLWVRGGLFRPQIVSVPIRFLVAVVPQHRRLVVDWTRVNSAEIGR